MTSCASPACRLGGHGVWHRKLVSGSRWEMWLDYCWESSSREVCSCPLGPENIAALLPQTRHLRSLLS